MLYLDPHMEMIQFEPIVDFYFWATGVMWNYRGGRLF